MPLKNGKMLKRERERERERGVKEKQKQKNTVEGGGGNELVGLMALRHLFL